MNSTVSTNSHLVILIIASEYGKRHDSWAFYSANGRISLNFHIKKSKAGGKHSSNVRRNMNASCKAVGIYRLFHNWNFYNNEKKKKQNTNNNRLLNLALIRWSSWYGSRWVNFDPHSLDSRRGLIKQPQRWQEEIGRKISQASIHFQQESCNH